MADVTYTANTYAGQEYTELIMPSLLPPDGLVDKGLVTALPGIKKREVLRLIDIAVEFQDPSCNFVDQDTDLTFDERYIDPVKYEVMIEMCYADLRQGWDAMKLKKGSANDYVPPADIEAAFLELVSVKMGIMNEQMYINGKAGVTAGAVTFAAAYPGIIARLVAGSDVNKVSMGSVVSGGTSFALTGITVANPGVVTVASTANLRTGDRVTITGTNNAPLVGGVTINGQSFTITVINATTFSLNAQVTGTAPTSGTVTFVNSTNAIAVLSYVLMNTPQVTLDNPDTKIWVSPVVARAYAFAQAAVANGAGSYYIGKKELDFLGNKLTEVKYLPSNVIIIAPSTHIFLGFDEAGDETNIRVVDLSKTTLEDKWRYKASMKTDINYVKGGDIVIIYPQ